MTAIHQLVPALHDGDAVGDSARALRDYLRSRGFLSDIYSYDIDESISSEALNFRQTGPQLEKEDVLILHFALPSGMSGFLKNAQCRKAIIYHNITPAYYWLDYNPMLVHLATEGRKELMELAPHVDRAAGVSEFNALELQQTGYRSICVVPLLIDETKYQTEPSPAVLKIYNDGLFNLLFVGRVAPNKKFEDVLKVYFYYKRLFDPLSRVILVGKTSVAPEYYAALKLLMSQLAFMPEDIVFTGSVDWSELVAYYKTAHIFLSMSEHEGFCLPLLEAMMFDLPIVAYSSSAIPYTLGNAGWQFDSKNLPEIAAACHEIRKNDALRQNIIEKQRARLKNYSRESVEKAVDEFLAPML